MNEINVDKWVNALESGEYNQGEGSLGKRYDDGNVEYCCLGVACDLYEKETGDLVVREKIDPTLHATKKITYDDRTDFLPEKVKIWLGLKTDNGEFYDPSTDENRSLTELNDEGEDFELIAKYIRGAKGDPQMGLFKVRD